VCEPLAANPRKIVSRALLVELEWLRIELGGEGLDPLPVYPHSPGAERLPAAKSSRYRLVIVEYKG